MTVRWLADALCVGWLTSARFVVGAVRCGASERAVAFVLRSFVVVVATWSGRDALCVGWSFVGGAFVVVWRRLCLERLE